MVAISPEHLRYLLVVEAELGERVMKALMLRQVHAFSEIDQALLVFGDDEHGRTRSLCEFLRRNGQPHDLLRGEAEAALLPLLGPSYRGQEDAPVVLFPCGLTLLNPPERLVAQHLGMLREGEWNEPFDVAIVGAGPAGLATAVYAASEGLRVAILDRRSYGGQAGASARIENYLGFPAGVSGQALADRAYAQAQKFGAKVLIPCQVTNIDCSRRDGYLALAGEEGQRVRARTVVIATGARYRRPSIPELARFEGTSVWYWASQAEANLVSGERVVLIGGGNSAGQAAVFLAGAASEVVIVIRGKGLESSMSAYLIERLRALPNVRLRTETEVVGLKEGRSGRLAAVVLKAGASVEAEEVAASHLFVFAGAEPATDWLMSCEVARDSAGFVLTGLAVAGAENGPRGPLETSTSGVFAVGDVRSGSVKRVGAGIGEGAQVVAAIHTYLTSMVVGSPVAGSLPESLVAQAGR